MEPLTTVIAFAAGATGTGALLRYLGGVSRPTGFAIPWWTFLENTVLCSDLGFLAPYRLNTVPDAQADPGHAATLLASFHRMLLEMPSNWGFYHYAIHEPTPYTLKPKTLGNPLDLAFAARRAAWESAPPTTTAHYLILYYRPSLATNKRKHLLFTDSAAEHDNLLRDYERGQAALIHQLSPFEPTPLAPPETLALFRRLLFQSPTATVPPHHHMDIADLFPIDIVSGLRPFVNDAYVRTVSVLDYPEQLAVTTPVSRLHFPLTLCTRVIALSHEEGLKTLHNLKDENRKGQRGAKTRLRASFTKSDKDPESLQLDKDTFLLEGEKRIAEVLMRYQAGTVRLFRCARTGILSHSDPAEVDDMAARLCAEYASIGYTARTEHLGATEEYLGTIPGAPYGIRALLLTSDALVESTPIVGHKLEPRYNPSSLMPPATQPIIQLRTIDNTSYHFHSHSENLGHALVLGRSGAGKTTLALTLAHAFYLHIPDARVVYLDYQRTAVIPGAYANGTSYDAGKFSLAPLRIVQPQTDIPRAMTLIELICNLQGVSLNAPLRALIADTFATFPDLPPTEQHLSNFAALVQSQEIRNALKPYLRDGILGQLLDGHESNLSLASTWSTIEMSEILKLSEVYRTPALYLLVDRLLPHDNTSPLLIIVDEAWTAFLHPILESWLAEAFATARKNHCSLILATQHLSQLARSPAVDLILAQAVTRFLTPDADADKYADDYQRLGLAPFQISLLKQLTAHRYSYLLTRPALSAQVKLELTPEELAILAPPKGMSQSEAVLTFRDMSLEQWFHFALKRLETEK